MHSNLKTSDIFFFQGFAQVSQIRAVKTDFGQFFSFKVHLMLFP